MAKTLWLLLKPALLMVGILTLVYPVLVALYMASGRNEIFFTYINSFFLLYDIIIGICAAQASSAYAPLALSFGVTRRTLRRATAGFFILLPLICVVLDFLCNSITVRLFYTGMNPLFASLVEYPLQGAGLKWIVCSSMLWTGTLDFGALPMWKRILVIVLLCIIYLQIALFMFLGTLRPQSLLNGYSLVLSVLSFVFAALALHRLRRLTITQA